MRAYQIMGIALNIMLADIRKYYLFVLFTVLFPASCIIMLKIQLHRRIRAESGDGGRRGPGH